MTSKSINTVMAGIYSDDESTVSEMHIPLKLPFFDRILCHFDRNKRSGSRVPRQIIVRCNEREEESYLKTMSFYNISRNCVALRKYDANGEVFYRVFSEPPRMDAIDLKGDEALNEFRNGLSEYDPSWQVTVVVS